MPVKKNVYFPIRVVILFLMTTLVMYFISPFDWPTNNSLLLIIYNLSVFICLYGGFSYGVKNFNKNINWNTYQIINPLSRFLKSNLNLLLILNLIFIYPKFVMKMGKGFVSIEYIIKSIGLGLLSPELAYSAKLIDNLREFLSLTHPLVFSYMVLSPLLFLTIPLMLYLWDELTRNQRIITIIIIISDILTYITIGTNKGIFDIVIMLPFILYAKKHSFGNRVKQKLKSNRYFIITILISVFALTYFSINIAGRTGIRFGYDAATGKTADENTLIMSVLPIPLQTAYISLDSYLTQGYYALDKAFDMDFEFCYGVGHSSLLTSLFEKSSGKNYINYKTYQYRLDGKTGYSQKQRWHTFYVSMANDLSFLGVLIFILILGYWFANIWLEILYRRNLIAVGIMPLFMIMFFYFGSNNQILGFDDQSVMFWGLLGLFFYMKRRTIYIPIVKQ